MEDILLDERDRMRVSWHLEERSKVVIRNHAALRSFTLALAEWTKL